MIIYIKYHYIRLQPKNQNSLDEKNFNKYLCFFPLHFFLYYSIHFYFKKIMVGIPWWFSG